MKSMKTVVTAALSAGVCLLSLGLEAVTYTWKGGGATNKWSDPTNWLVDGAATEGYPCVSTSDYAIFNADCEAMVDLDVQVSIRSIAFNGPKDLTLTTSNGGSVYARLLSSGEYNVKTVAASKVTMDAIAFTADIASLTLSPTWSLHITGSATVKVNNLNNYSTMMYQPQSVIRVDGGSTLSVLTQLTLGGFGVLEIEDATVTTPTLGMNAGNGSGAGGGTVIFKGTHPLLKVTTKVTSGSSATYMRGCDFRFVVPEEGFTATPLQVTGAMFSGLASLPRTCHYTVDVDSPFVTKGVPGTLTLATSGGTGVDEAHFAGVAPYVTRGEVALSSDSNTVSFVQYAETGTLRVTAEPMEYGDGYGYRYGLAENAALALSAPAAPSENLVCTGYRLFDIDAKGKRTEVAGSPFSGTSCAYVHGKTRRELRWVWTKPKVYVSKTGSDANGGTGWDDAFASIQKAVDAYDYATVYVGKGVYDVGTVVLAVTNGVELVGFGDGPEDVAIMRSTTDRLRILKVDHPQAVVTNVLVSHFRAPSDYCTGTCGGVSLLSGTLDGCIISNCLSTATANNAAYWGMGINMSGGTVRNCLITQCTTPRCNYGDGGGYSHGGGIYMTDGLVENCQIRDCMLVYRTTASQLGGGVYMLGGTLRGCLITGNRSVGGSGSGVYARSGQIENCTIVANGVATLAAAGVYLFGQTYTGYAGEFINNIVRDNVDTTGINNLLRETQSKIPTAGLCLNNDSNVLITPEEGNITTDPLFHDDYRIGYSACVGAGVWRSWMVEAVDMDGNARLQEATPDLGCYAYVKSSDIICTFTAETDGSLDNAEVTLKADVVGDDDGVVYYWRVVRADGTVASDASGSDLKTLVLNLGAGSYDVRLAVTNAAEKGFVTPVTTGAAVVKASRAYVNATGSNSYPYDTLAKGAHDFFAAAEVVDPSGTVYVGDGRYVLEDTVNLKADAVHRVESVNGPGNCILQAGNASVFASVPFVQLVAADACLAGCTVVGGAKGEYNAGSAYSTTHLVKMTGANAVVTNCVIRDAKFIENNTCSGLDMSAGTAVDITVLHCGNSMLHALNYGTRAVALYLHGGLADRLRICDCWTENSSSQRVDGGIVAVEGGELRNALVANNSPSHSAAVYVKDATLANCTIVSNTCTDTREYQTGTTRNTHCGGLIAASSATVVNTIVSDNFSTFANAESNLYATAAFDLTYSTVPDRVSLAGEGNVVTRPVFKSIVRQDYHLKRSSAERLVGRRLDWMTEGSKDLDGAPRVCGGKPDMGCYENPLSGLTLLIR